MSKRLEYIKRNIYIFYVVFTNAMAFASLGVALAWASPSMVKLLASDSSIPLNSSQGSWAGSLLAIGAVVVSIPYTYLFSQVGRKWLIVGIGIFYISGWITLICSSEVWHIYFGRFLLGTAVGPTFGIIPVYMAEVVGKRVRGISVAILLISQSSGAIMQYSIGPIVSLYMHNLISITVPFIFFILSLMLPESPYYLIGIKEVKRAEETLMQLRGAQDLNEIKEEMDSIKKCLKESPPMVFKDILSELSLFRTKKAICIILLATFAQQFSGIGAVVVYMETIFIEMQSPILPSYAVIISEILNDITSLFSLLIIEKIGRKPLLAMSSTICVIAHVLNGVFFYFKGSMGAQFSYLGVTSLFLMQVGFGLGLSSVPVLIISEVMSFTLKGWLSGLYQIVQGIFNASCIKIFQILRAEYGTCYPFWLFASCVFISVVILIYMVPETKNRTLQEIQNLLSKKTKKLKHSQVEYTEKYTTSV